MWTVNCLEKLGAMVGGGERKGQGLVEWEKYAQGAIYLYENVPCNLYHIP